VSRCREDQLEGDANGLRPKADLILSLNSEEPDAGQGAALHKLSRPVREWRRGHHMNG